MKGPARGSGVSKGEARGGTKSASPRSQHHMAPRAVRMWPASGQDENDHLQWTEGRPPKRATSFSWNLGTSDLTGQKETVKLRICRWEVYPRLLSFNDKSLYEREAGGGCDRGSTG